jgi:hypothetical protein
MTVLSIHIAAEQSSIMHHRGSAQWLFDALKVCQGTRKLCVYIYSFLRRKNTGCEVVITRLQSRETEKYGHESHRTRNEEWPCWRYQQQFTPPADGNWLRSPRTRLKHGSGLYSCLKWVFISFACSSIFRYCILLNRIISFSNHLHIGMGVCRILNLLLKVLIIVQVGLRVNLI